MSFNNQVKNVRSNGMAMILLVVLVVEFFIALSLISYNRMLQLEIEHNNLTQEVFISPNSQITKFKPAKEQMLLVEFVDNVTQSLVTYSEDSFAGQATTVSKYMSSLMLARFNHYYVSSTQRGKQSRSSIFKADKSRTEVLKKEVFYDEKTNDQIQEYVIMVNGERRFIRRGVLSKPINQTLRLTVRKVTISEANPYGFILTKFDLSKI